MMSLSIQKNIPIFENGYIFYQLLLEYFILEGGKAND